MSLTTATGQNLEALQAPKRDFLHVWYDELERLPSLGEAAAAVYFRHTPSGVEVRLLPEATPRTNGTWPPRPGDLLITSTRDGLEYWQLQVVDFTDTFEHRQAKHARRAAAAASRNTEKAARATAAAKRRAESVSPVTLSNMTVIAAGAAILDDVDARIELNHGRLVIFAPPNPRLADAAAVLYAAEEHVIAAFHKGRLDVDRLPNRRVTPRGALI